MILDGKTALGVRLENEDLLADKVIMNADFAHAMTTMVPDSKRKRWSNKKLDKKGYSCSTFMLYLGMDKKYDQPHHQIYASSNYENNLKEITKNIVSWEDPSLYVQNASVTDSTLAPEGCSTLYVLVPVSNQHESIVWDDIKDKYRDKILDQMEKLGFDDVREHIES